MDALFLGDYVLTKQTASAAADMSEAEMLAAHAAACAADNEE
jgi:uncharacterized protein HemY